MNSQNPRVERLQEVCDGRLLVAKHVPKERLGSTDDYGFSPFSIDVKPGTACPASRATFALQKIAARVEGTRMASEEPGEDRVDRGADRQVEDLHRA